MAETEAEQDPSIEDILHSIRQIISEDDEEGADGGDLEAVAEETADGGDLESLPEDDDTAGDVDGPKAEEDNAGPEIDLTPETDDDKAGDVDGVLDLDEKVDGGDLKGVEEEAMSSGDIDALFDEGGEDSPDIEMADKAEDKDIELDLRPEGDETHDGGTLLSETAEDQAVAALGQLAGNMLVERQDHVSGITLEDITRELMRPLLKEWLDKNMPRLIEKQVQKEIENLVEKMNKG